MDNDFDQAIATVLRGKRAEKEIGLAQITKATGIPERTLIRYLKGQRPIPLAKMIAIARAIGEDGGSIVSDAIEAVKVAEQQQRV